MKTVFIVLAIFIGGLSINCWDNNQMGYAIISGSCSVFVIIQMIRLHFIEKKEREEEERNNPQIYEDNDDGESSGSMLWSIIFLIILLPFKIIGAIFSRGSSKIESSADRCLRESREYYANDLAGYQARQAQKKQLLSQARNLEDQARYGSDYQRNQLRKEAEELRRQAGRL